MALVHRRRVLFGVAGAAVAAAGSLRLERARAEHGGPHPPPGSGAGQQPAQTVATRSSVGALAPDSTALGTYRRAIAAMKALPPNDPRNWTRMAQVHQDFCPHNNWYLLPWHRAYLVAFERICAQLGGDPAFRLPYWDWTVHRRIPAPFSQPTHDGRPNALFLPPAAGSADPTDPAAAFRAVGPGEAMSDFAIGGSVIEAALREPNFERFAGSRPRQGRTAQNSLDSAWLGRAGSPGPLESNPHNYVHGFIGGTMGTFMSPLDPLFWLHHGNLDRLWDVWIRRGFANSTNTLWLNFRFSNQFVRADGRSWQPRVSDLLETRSLGYAYPTTRSAPSPAEEAGLLRSLPPIDNERLVLRSAAVAPDAIARPNEVLSVTLPTARSPQELTSRVLGPPGSLTRGTAAGTRASSDSPSAAGRVIAEVEADIGAGPTPHVRVFLSCPYLTVETPASDPHFVGSFAFFAPTDDGGRHGSGHGGAHRSTGQGRSIRTSLDLTRTLAALRAAGRTPDKLELQLLPVPTRAGVTPPAVNLRQVAFATA